jgi:hypothetical protein
MRGRHPVHYMRSGRNGYLSAGEEVSALLCNSSTDYPTLDHNHCHQLLLMVCLQLLDRSTVKGTVRALLGGLDSIQWLVCPG